MMEKHHTFVVVAKRGDSFPRSATMKTPHRGPNYYRNSRSGR